MSYFFPPLVEEGGGALQEASRKQNNTGALKSAPPGGLSPLNPLSAWRRAASARRQVHGQIINRRTGARAYRHSGFTRGWGGDSLCSDQMIRSTGHGQAIRAVGSTVASDRAALTRQGKRPRPDRCGQP